MRASAVVNGHPARHAGALRSCSHAATRMRYSIRCVSGRGAQRTRVWARLSVRSRGALLDYLGTTLRCTSGAAGARGAQDARNRAGIVTAGRDGDCGHVPFRPAVTIPARFPFWLKMVFEPRSRHRSPLIRERVPDPTGLPSRLGWQQERAGGLDAQVAARAKAVARLARRGTREDAGVEIGLARLPRRRRCLRYSPGLTPGLRRKPSYSRWAVPIRATRWIPRFVTVFPGTILQSARMASTIPVTSPEVPA